MAILHIDIDGSPRFVLYQQNTPKDCLGENKNKVSMTDSLTPTTQITEEEIRKENPWQGEYVNANRSLLYDENAQWVLKCDAPTIQKFNDKHKGTEYEFKLGVRPEPFNGNPLKAKVIVLSLNPGYIDRINNLLARLMQTSTQKDIINTIIRFKDDQLRLETESFYCERNKKKGELSYRDAYCMIEGWYWYNIFDKFRKDAKLDEEGDSYDIIYNNIALVQYVGYSSTSWKGLPQRDILPSQKFTRKLIHYLAINTDDLFVVSRSEKLWYELIGKEIWDKLEKEERFVHRATHQNKNGINQAIRTQGFSENTFEPGGFKRIIDKLKDS